MNQTTQFPQRVRNALHFRELTVLESKRVSGFQRVVLGGDALAGFTSRGFDDHIKVFFPQDGAPFVPPEVTDEGIVWAGDVRPPSRDYTPLFDEARQQLTLDFYVHASGVASDWAVAAAPGDTLCIGGRAARWWCRKVTPGSFTCAMSPACRRCAAVSRRFARSRTRYMSRPS